MNRHAIRRSRSASALTVLCIVLAAVVPRALAAQTYWRVPGGLGGALAGAGAGWMIDVARWGGGSSDEPFRGPTLVMTPIGLGIGGVLGFLGGSSADKRLARGDTLTRGGRAALRVATFLAPVAVGSAIAFTVINPSDEGRPKAVSDEMVAMLTIGGGTVLGFVAQHKFAPALRPRARIGVAPHGRGVALSIPVGW
jgi:hypothetical protein